MSGTPHIRLSREEEAMAEMNRTRIQPSVARALTGFFLFCILSVPLGQHMLEFFSWRTGDRSSPEPAFFELFREAGAHAQAVFSAPRDAAHVLSVNRKLIQSMHSFEQGLEEDSWLSDVLLDPVQSFMLSWLGAGNEQAYPGRDGWLFFRPSFDALTGPGYLDPIVQRRRADAAPAWEERPQTDSIAAIHAFQQDLAARNIQLILVPIPEKLAVEPEFFNQGQAVLLHRDFPEWKARVEALGVRVMDVPAVLKQLDDGTPQYLKTDTHWRHETMAGVAAALATEIKHLQIPSPSPVQKWKTVAGEVSARGDLDVMLGLPEQMNPFQPETVSLEQVEQTTGGPWQPDPFAEILFLGDSFSNIYSEPGMNWGASAGFAEHLSLCLGQPLDTICRNDAGAHATREILSRELHVGKDRLAGKKIVVWEFAARELAVGNWKILSARLQPSGDAGDYVAIEPGQPREVRATIVDASPVPRPGSVPYADHIRSLHLRDLVSPDGEALDGHALALIQSMSNRVWTAAASWSSGDTVHLQLQAWSDVADRYASINTSNLDGDIGLLADPNWAVPLTAGDAPATSSALGLYLYLFGSLCCCSLALVCACRKSELA